MGFLDAREGFEGDHLIGLVAEETVATDDFGALGVGFVQDDGSRAIGTFLDPKGKAIAAIAKGEGYLGEADILGKPYVADYEPIRDANSNIIGIYYFGYLKK